MQTEFHILVRLVATLRRLERLEQGRGRRILSPQEFRLLRGQIARVRGLMPPDVLEYYEALKQSRSAASSDTRLFSLVVLLEVITRRAGQGFHLSPDLQDNGRPGFRVVRVVGSGFRSIRRRSLTRGRNP
ncbi:MAG TPA: hypothetical protein VMP11_08445 [Verrucomicrobiae bacterium]|nr:hypothetical protein [Verrucomicrobiae bacterium]